MITTQKKARIVLGLLTFGPPGSEFHGSRVTSIDTFNDILDKFQDRGYSDVDTGRIYVNGLQEGFTRQAKWQQRGLTLGTKWWPMAPGDHAKTVVKKQLEKSLSELGSESVDIFYLHAPDRSIPFEETLSACQDLYQAGRFRKLGLSNYAAWEVAEICTIAKERGWVQPSVYQAMYNAFTRAIDDELVSCCRKFGLSIDVYNPLAGGALSGKYKSREAPSDGRFSNVDPRIGAMYRERYFQDSTFEALRILEPIAEQHNLTLPQIALRWCMHHSKLHILDGRDGIVIGVSSLAQLEANLNFLEEGPLPEPVVQALEYIWRTTTKATCPSYWRQDPYGCKT